MLVMILRHAKAEKDSPTGRDEDRPLAARGRRQAAFIAAQLAEASPPLAAPAAVLSSRAERARATATVVAEALGVQIAYEPALSLGSSPGAAIALMRKLVGRSEPVLLVGHNPQLEDLAASLTGEDDDLRTGELVAMDITVTPKSVQARALGRLRLEEDD
jgi:phosphohistidine phosphatase